MQHYFRLTPTYNMLRLYGRTGESPSSQTVVRTGPVPSLSTGPIPAFRTAKSALRTSSGPK